MATINPQADFIVSGSDPLEYRAVSAAAEQWLTASGKAEPDAPDLVRRDRVSSMVFMEALTRNGFTCCDSSGIAMASPVASASSGPNALGLSCACLTAAVFLIPAGALVYGIDWLFGPAAAAVAALLGIVIIAGGFVLAKQQESGEKTDQAGLSSLGFSVDTFTGLGGGSYIAIDQRGRRLAVKIGGSLHLRDFGSIVGVEIEEDGSSIQRSNRGNQMQGAIVGGLLAGPAGLIVGGLSGSKRVEQKVHAVTLNVFTSDSRTPTIKVPMLKVHGGVPINSGSYANARQQAQDWYSRIASAAMA